MGKPILSGRRRSIQRPISAIRRNSPALAAAGRGRLACRSGTIPAWQTHGDPRNIGCKRP